MVVINMAKTFKSDNDIVVGEVLIIPSSTARLSKAEVLNIRDTFKFLIENVPYHTPTDRCLAITAEVSMLHNMTLVCIVNVVPCYRGNLRNKKQNHNAEPLARSMTIVGKYKTADGDLIEGGNFQRQLLWVLNYYGFTLMYAKHHQQIRVDIQDKHQIQIDCL